MITIYERNLWPKIVSELHPRYMAMSDFTITLEISEGPVAKKLEDDPLLHQQIIDAVNSWVNNQTYKILHDKVFKEDMTITCHVNTKDFDQLTEDYRRFDEYTRQLIFLTNDNIKRLVQKTIKANGKDSRSAGLYIGSIAVKLSFKVAGMVFSTITMVAGTVSAIVSGGTAIPLAIPGTIVGFVGLIQSAAELARDLVKAIETMDMARADAIVSLKKLEESYKGNSTGAIGRKEVLVGAVNKVFSGFVDFNTISTLSDKFDLWGKKILLVDQKTHNLARRLPVLFQKAAELQMQISKAQAPIVPSREGCKLIVPPPIPSRDGRRPVSSLGNVAPQVPSRQGRVSANAYRDIYSRRTPPPVPSKYGRAPAPVQPATPGVPRDFEVSKGDQKSRKIIQLNKIIAKTHHLVPEISRLQTQVQIHRQQSTHFTKVLGKLKSQKPGVAKVIEVLGGISYDLGKSGLSAGIGSFGLGFGMAASQGVTDSVHTIGSFVVEGLVESAFLANDLVDGIGELDEALSVQRKAVKRPAQSAKRPALV